MGLTGAGFETPPELPLLEPPEPPVWPVLTPEPEELDCPVVCPGGATPKCPGAVAVWEADVCCPLPWPLFPLVPWTPLAP